MQDLNKVDAPEGQSAERDADAGAAYVLATVDPPQGASVLHFGCGDGNVLRRLKERRPDLDCHGVDTSSSGIEVMGEGVDALRFEPSDVVTKDGSLGEYDCIFSYRTLQHVQTADLEKLFRVLGKHLKTSGAMWHLSVPDARKRWQYWLEDFQNNNDGGAVPDALKAGRFFLQHLRRLIKDDRRFGEDGTSIYHDHGTLMRSAGDAWRVDVFRPSEAWYLFDVRVTKRGG
jgi:trans-aconitate methyltransferase